MQDLNAALGCASLNLQGPVPIPHASGHLRGGRSRVILHRADVPPNLRQWLQEPGGPCKRFSTLPVCVCKAGTRVSDQPCVDEQCTRPAQIWAPPRALTLFWVVGPSVPLTFLSPFLHSFIESIPLCYVMLPCLSGLVVTANWSLLVTANRASIRADRAHQLWWQSPVGLQHW